MTNQAVKPGRRPGKWLAEFKQWMQSELDRPEPSTQPLPTTRDLAEKFGVNNSTVFRHFVKYEETGHLWRSEGGRFYDARVRSLVEKPRPIACLLRRIENWSFLYQEWMEGIATACEEVGRATLLWHDEDLVCHREVGAPPTFATPEQQKKSLATFLKHYGNSIGGLILDQIWCDEALDSIPAAIRRKSVILGRPGPPDIISIIPDWKKSATLAINNLQSNGCELIYPVSPFDQDPAINHALSRIHAAAEKIEYPLAAERKAATASERKRLLDELSRIKQPIGLIVPEDNIAQLLYQEVKTRGLATVHILSIQGTRHSSETPRIRTDYAALGAKAVAALTTAPDHAKNGTKSSGANRI